MAPSIEATLKVKAKAQGMNRREARATYRGMKRGASWSTTALGNLSSNAVEYLIPTVRVGYGGRRALMQ